MRVVWDRVKRNQALGISTDITTEKAFHNEWDRLLKIPHPVRFRENGSVDKYFADYMNWVNKKPGAEYPCERDMDDLYDAIHKDIKLMADLERKIG